MVKGVRVKSVSVGCYEEEGEGKGERGGDRRTDGPERKGERRTNKTVRWLRNTKELEGDGDEGERGRRG